nr:radical SAM protein [Pseudogemmobacter hezensis]
MTSNCNLRCTYCPVTHPNYQGRDLAPDRFASVLDVVRLMPKGANIDVNGHGETTFHPNWMDLCGPIVEQGMRPVIISNLAKIYTDDEIALLSKFGTIQVSLDSSDAAMMRRIRKAVTPDRILANINLIRDAAGGGAGAGEPIFSISCGLYNPSVWTLPDFAQWIIDAKIGSVTFWNLVPYEHSKLTTPLISLYGAELERARRNISAARAMLDDAGIACHFAGDFSGSDGKPLVAAT